MASLATFAAITAGDLDLSVTFTVSPGNDGTEHYVWSLATPDGECSLRYAGAFGLAIYPGPYTFTLKVRGVDVLVADSGGLANVAATPQGWDDGDRVTLRVWYKPVTLPSASVGIRYTVNGCTSPDALATASGAALSSATTGYFGSSPTLTEPMLATLLASSGGPSGSVANLTPEIVQLGDSTSNSPAVGGPLGGLIYAFSEPASRPGIVSFAMAGETTSQQLARFQASPYWGASSVKAIIVQTGINDGNLLSTPVALSTYLAAIASIRSGNPSAKLFASETIPWSQTNAATIVAINSAIGAGIAGSDGVISEHVGILGGGSNPATLLPQYQFQGGPHDNEAGRNINARAFRDTLVANHLLPPVLYQLLM